MKYYGQCTATITFLYVTSCIKGLNRISNIGILVWKYVVCWITYGNWYFITWLWLRYKGHRRKRMIWKISWNPRRSHRGPVWYIVTPIMKSRPILWLPGNQKAIMWRERNTRTTSSLINYLLTSLSLYLESLASKETSFGWKGGPKKSHFYSTGMQDILQELFHNRHEQPFFTGMNQYRVFHADIWLQYEVKGLYAGTVVFKYSIHYIKVMYLLQVNK